jgi:hypothetical protein
MNNKNITSKKWIRVSLFTTLFGFTILMLINYIIDPFNIFHSKILKHDFQVNERFVKIEYLEENHNKFNGYMIGSSRIGTTPPKTVEQYIPNAKIYNMTLNGATLYDYLMHIRYMIKKNYPIETIYMQLDVINMTYYGGLESDYLSKLHPYIEDKSLPLFYFDYLSGFFPFNIKNKIDQNINYTFKTTYVLETGIWANPTDEKKIDVNCKEYVANQKSFHTKNRRILKYLTQKETIRDLKEITALCRANNIKLYTFMMPHNQIMMDSFSIEDYLDYLKDIANITDFYDFSGYNTITTNNCNYYERSHYRPLVGELIAAKIFNTNKIDVPNDFGKLVTKNNIVEHLNNRKKEILKHDIK